MRDAAAVEAEKVHEQVSKFPNTQHHILQWDGNKPDTGVMQAARQARYDLLTSFCADHNVPVLMTAHHSDDQVETFLIRLTKGSGIDGLGCTQKYSKLNDTLMLYRPLLDFSHQDLVDYCTENDIEWIEDPTNNDTSYERNRLRKSTEIL